MTWREPDSKPMIVDLDQDLTKPSPDYENIEGEPTTIDDEFARDDAPEQEWENDA